MKRLVVGVIIVVAVVVGSLGVFADGPWANPGTGSTVETVVVVDEG